MATLDWLVVAVYFSVMAYIGYVCMKKVKKQDDFFMGGRGFGKLMQTFAAFGAGTGSHEPILIGKTVFMGGLSGVWSAMYYLFVTPVYWFAGVWYRRMRLTTLGDWFAERFDSKKLGAAFAVFGLFFYVVYIALMFSAITKFVQPLLGFEGEAVQNLEYVLLPSVAVVVMLYGILGGVAAAYFTDMIQGFGIILLSILLIPFGLSALVKEFGKEGDSWWTGLDLLHSELPAEYFTLTGQMANSDFSLTSIIFIVLMTLAGVVVYPHFIMTGGGTAKTEFDARVGITTGNFIKRFCTVGWALTALIGVGLYSGVPEVVADPGILWGYTSKALLPAGLLGLMFCCLLAALMSSVDSWMIVTSALIVKNVYLNYFNKEASDAQCLKVARIVGVLLMCLSVVLALAMKSDVYELLILTWIVPLIFAPIFWVGMFWRKATVTAAWVTLAFTLCLFFVLPVVISWFPAARTSTFLTKTNKEIVFKDSRPTIASDIRKAEAKVTNWEAKEVEKRDEKPTLPVLGEPFELVSKTGGKSIYWKGGLKKNKVGVMEGQGWFLPEYLIYDLVGFDIANVQNSTLKAMGFPLKIILPFLIMIFVSFFTKPVDEDKLNRHYAKMQTPVDPDVEADTKNIENNYNNFEALKKDKLLTQYGIELTKFTKTDIVGFVISLGTCAVIIGLLFLVAG